MVDLGPLMSESQVTRACEQIHEAVSLGAKIKCGFTPGSKVEGRLFPPTVIDHVPFDARLAREETFAPIMPILRVRDENEALAISNDSPYGLAGYVFSRDVSKARALARRLNVGSVCLNDVLVNYHCTNAPLGGVKSSGLGFRNSPEALLQFCYSQTLVEDRPFLEKISRMVQGELTFPYRPKTVRLLRWLMKLLYP
jgi:acyl-CoA reductase-like NAD-dependent aldehyde dehydrogenase